MLNVLNLLSRTDPWSYLHFPLYIYHLVTYLKFLAFGKCVDFPLVVQIQTQSLCNSACTICPYPAVSKQLNHGVMEEELFRSIANELASQPLLAKINFQLQNEPLMDKRIFEFVKYLKSKNANKICTLTSNGVLLNTFDLTELMESELNSLVISLNAHSEEAYARITGGLDYKRVVENIHCLTSGNSMKNKLTLSFIPMEHIENDIQQALQYWNSRGVKTRMMELISFNKYLEFPYHSYYRGSEIVRYWRRVMFQVRKAMGCEIPFYQMHVLYNGDVIACCLDWKRTTVVGNVRFHSLKEIWNSAEMNRIRRLIIKRRYSRIDSCRECSQIIHNNSNLAKQ